MKIYFIQFMHIDQCYIKKMQYLGKERTINISFQERREEGGGGEKDVYNSN